MKNVNFEDYFRYDLFPKISRTFSLTISRVNDKELRKYFEISYAVFRIIDTIEDSNLEIKSKKKYMGNFFDIIKKKENLEDKISSLREVPTLHSGYKNLLKNVEGVVELYDSLPSNIKRNIRSSGIRMGNGFLSEDIQHIDTIEDQNRYCYYAAGIVGHLITDMLAFRGYITEDKSKSLKNSAKKFGFALQKVNIMKDLVNDVKDERYYWPRKIIESEGLDYKKIINPKFKDKTKIVLEKLIEDAKKYCKEALDYINELPFEEKHKEGMDPNGVKIFCGDSLLFSYATIRVLPKKLLSEQDVKISREEAVAIDYCVRALVNDKRTFDDFARHLQSRNGEEYLKQEYPLKYKKFDSIKKRKIAKT